MGWFVAPAPSFEVWHDGSTANFHAHVAMDRRSSWGFAVLANSENHLSGPKVGDLALQVRSLLRGETATPISRATLPWQLLTLIGLACLQVAGLGLTIRRAARTVRRPNVVRVAALFALQVGGALALVFAAPYIVHTTIGAMLMFAPDSGYLFVLNGVIGAVWACVRTTLSLRRSR